ncbi:hypothetical protein TSUD_139740 [Trifolium subterraneum]|uniref:CCHC-type domain-containing protein n=1 Tax=Trifolium subterraneum TaxID=3900 RepID=A0A2Z6NYN8_TRISU|nr:hypothetical protein TSUD_139740 [Trifolium subterraneum]
MERLTINEEEEEELELLFDETRENNTEPEFTLVGRFLIDRPIRFRMMRLKISEYWSPVCGVSIKEVKSNLFLFKLFHRRDLERVLKQGPWSFDGYTLILGLLQQGGVPSEVPLNHIPFWVQIHDVPAGCMSLTAGKQLGNFIGEFMEYDEKNNSNILSTYMRIRVLIDVRKPLMRWKKIKSKGGSHEVKFKYERLGSLCYYCGLLGHIEDFCNQLFDVPNDDGVRRWSSDLRAEKKKGTNESINRWLREEASPSRFSAPSQPVTASGSNSVTAAADQSALKLTLILNNSGAKLSLAEAFTHPHLIFPKQFQQPIMEVTKSTLNVDELMEEKMQIAINKRSRVHVENFAMMSHNKGINVEKPCINSNNVVMINGEQAPMEGIQQVNLEATKDKNDKQLHFLSVEPGSQTCQAS